MHIHFIGVCGTAMGNVALMMRAMGEHVTGSDQDAYPPMSNLLAEAGIQVMAGYRGENLQPQPDLIVVGNAISRGNPELEAALNRRLRYTSLPELLKERLIEGRRSYVLTGTHGKTTTSSMLSWVLQCAGRSPNFMIGGVPGNFSSGWQYSPESDIVVLEGDEYDTAYFDKRSKFFHYLPSALLINNLEFDHADIFDSLDQIKLAFRRLVNLVPSNGLIAVNGDDPVALEVTGKALAPVLTFGVGPESDWRVTDFQESSLGSRLVVRLNGEQQEIALTVPGRFNGMNAVGVAALARHEGLTWDEIRKGLSSFRNARRRLELVGTRDDVTLYDDFAHHPTAIAEVLKSLRSLHPGRRLRAIFEPRSNTTRRRIFQEELASALATADDVTISAVARLNELPENERLDTDELIRALSTAGVPAQFLTDADSIAHSIAESTAPGDVIVVMSNGGFGGLTQKLSTNLRLSERARGAPTTADRQT